MKTVNEQGCVFPTMSDFLQCHYRYSIELLDQTSKPNKNIPHINICHIIYDKTHIPKLSMWMIYIKLKTMYLKWFEMCAGYVAEWMKTNQVLKVK